MIKPLSFISSLLLFIVSLFAPAMSKAQCGNNPAPNAVASPVLQTICSGNVITPISINGNIPGTVFNWTRDNTSTVTGIPASGSGNIMGAMANSTNAPVAVNFTITPQTTGAAQLINESFNTILPAGWAQQNLSSTIGTQSAWFAGNAFPPYSPAGFIAANYNSTTANGTVSNWLFTPEILLKNGDHFSFYTRTAGPATFADRLQVRMSTNGASVNAGTNNTTVGDFTTLLIDINPTYISNVYPNTWTQINLTISGLPAAGVSGRIAFRYFIMAGPLPADNSAMIGIDDVVYTAANATCTGPSITAIVTVNPVAVVNSISNQSICNGTTTAAVNFGSPTTGGTIVYNWTNSNASIGLAASGTGNIPSFTATNSTAVPVTSTVTVTPVYTNNNAFSFINPAPILLPAAGTSGVGSPYPATVSVFGLPTSGVSLKAVRLINVSHTAAQDLDIVLVSPSGVSVILLSDAGGSNDLVNATLTLQDGAPAIPNNVNPISTGVYACTNLAGAVEPDSWPAPGPGVISNNPSLLSFIPASSNMNGLWKLFTIDNDNGDAGIINGGFELIFGNASSCPGLPTTFTYTINPTPAITVTSDIQPPLLPGQTMTLTATVSPAGGTFQWYKDAVLIPGATNNTLGNITVADLGTYTVKYTSTDGCINTSAGFNVFARANNNLYVYPNPSAEKFRISFYNEPNEEVTVTIYDAMGTKMFQKKYTTGAQRYSAITIDHHLAVGNYLVDVRNAKNQQVGIKQVSVKR